MFNNYHLKGHTFQRWTIGHQQLAYVGELKGDTNSFPGPLFWFDVRVYYSVMICALFHSELAAFTTQ